MFSGNAADVTTVERIVTTMEKRSGKSDRIWVMDCGMVSDDNIDFLRAGGRRYILGTPKSMLKKFAAELLKDDWTTIREGLEVKLCSRPHHDDEVTDAGKDSVEEDKETFILCRSRDRSHTEEATVQRFEQKIEECLVSMKARCEKQNRDPMKVAREIGRLLGKNTRAAKLFEVIVEKTKDDYARIQWKKVEVARNWATLSAGCYLLRSNVMGWSDEELWKAYIQLTEAAAAFRIQQSDLKIRSI